MKEASNTSAPAPNYGEELLIEAKELFYTMEREELPPEEVDPYPPILRYFKPNSKLYKLEDEFIRIKGGSTRMDIIRYIDKIKRQEKPPDKPQEDKLEELVKTLRDEVSGKPIDLEIKPRNMQKVIFK